MSSYYVLLIRLLNHIMNKEFVRVRSVKDITITLSLIIIGSICIGFVESQAINVLGFFTLFTGLLLLFILKTGYKDQETGIRYTKSEHYFAQSVKEQIIRQLRDNPASICYKGEDAGNGLRLDIYRNNEGMAYYQLFEYIPYKYEPCTEVFKTE